MAEYIELNAAITALNEFCYDQTASKYLSVDDCLVARDAIERAVKVLESLPAADVEPVRQWISVDDRLPEDDLQKGTKKKMIRCLVYTNKGTVKSCVRQRWEVNGKLVPWQWNKELFAKPTHWMYYPQPPKGE